MAETDVFLDRLTDALRSYAAEGPTDVEPLALARSISLGHGRRAGAPRWLDVTRGRRSILVLAALIALLLAATIGIASVGRLLRSDDPMTVEVDPANPIPAAMYGEWQFYRGGGDDAAPPDALTIDPTAPVLIRLPGGAPVEWAGRAVAYTPMNSKTGELLVRASGPCGEARYRIGIGSDQAVETSGALTNRIFLDVIADACPERAALLASPMGWVRPRPIPLVAGQIYGSWAFTEPFRFVAQSLDFGSEGTATGSVQQWGTRGGLRFFSGYFGWSVYVIDDQQLGADACDASEGQLADVPATPEAVGAWLRSSRGLTVAATVPFPVDGRTAVRYDLVGADGEHASGGCLGAISPFGPPTVDIGPTVYAIPTGDDTILVAVNGYPDDFDVVDRGIEALVRSMTFD